MPENFLQLVYTGLDGDIVDNGGFAVQVDDGHILDTQSTHTRTTPGMVTGHILPLSWP